MRAGDRVDGRFEIERLVGTGEMGKVYRAHDEATGMPAAVKILSRAERRGLERFTREAELLASLRIPGVVRYIAHGTTAAGAPYLAMEWLEGETLAARLTRGPLGIDESVALVRRAAEALGEVHRLGVVHRDIKPSNLMLVGGSTERVTVLDFGIAKNLELDIHPLTATGVFVGTPAYMAPEQARGQRELDARADVFALGCVLYECLCGQPAFVETDMFRLLMKVIVDEPRPLRELCPGAPEWLVGFLAGLLAKEPERRPADANAVAAELAAQAGAAIERERA